jgi:hypothetical protein
VRVNGYAVGVWLGGGDFAFFVENVSLLIFYLLNVSKRHVKKYICNVRMCLIFVTFIVNTKLAKKIKK